MNDWSQLFTPEVTAILFSALNYIIVEFTKKTKANPQVVWAIMCVAVGCIYVGSTFDFTESIVPQIVGKFALVVTVSTGMWKIVRQLNGREEEARQELIQHGKNIANSDKETPVVVVPVSSDSNAQVTVGQPVIVNASEAASTSVPVDNLSQAVSPSSEQNQSQEM